MHRDNNYVREDFIISHITTCRLWPDEIVFMKTIIQNCYVVTGVFAIGCLNTTSILFIVSWFFLIGNRFLFWWLSELILLLKLLILIPMKIISKRTIKEVAKISSDLWRRVSRLGYFSSARSCSSLLKYLILKKSFLQKSFFIFSRRSFGIKWMRWDKWLIYDVSYKQKESLCFANLNQWFQEYTYVLS